MLDILPLRPHPLLHLIQKVTSLKIAFSTVSAHETLKFGICGVDSPPPGSYFKTFAKIAIFMTCRFDAVFCFSRVDFPPSSQKW